MTRWRRAAAAVAVALAVAAGCTDGQDPGVDPADDRPATTSNTLGSCPPGGPDATTPEAGCLGPDGSVQRP